jgi:hypothetical protein
MMASRISSTQAGLGRGQNGIGCVDTDHILDFLTRIVRVAEGKSILFSTGTTSTPNSSAV